MKTDHSDRRLDNRQLFEKECLLTNGFGILVARTIDISEKGLGLFISETVPFKKSDKLLASLDIIRSSWYHVMWRRALNKTSSKVGLKFYQYRVLVICASCERIKDYKGHWKQIESNVKDHSEAKFSHGICSDCAKKLYPELYDEKKYTGKQQSKD